MPRPKNPHPLETAFIRVPEDIGHKLVAIARHKRASVAAVVGPLLRPAVARYVRRPTLPVPEDSPAPARGVRMAKVPADVAVGIRALKTAQRITSAPAAVGAMIRPAVDELYREAVAAEIGKSGWTILDAPAELV